ncbi:MAG TPA: M28 family peptidase [Solirubrobacteraceae bacterium]|nr:M28 family peptidase [Solirubrobacteraceae bacterium]
MGERAAAEWIAARLGELGAPARVEEEPAHGGYWWPIGLLNGAAAAAGVLALRSRSRLGRLLAGAAGAGAAAALWDDMGGGSQWFRRRALPMRSTWNVVAEAGPRDAERTVVLIAHHDAAHSGLVFHPALPRIPVERFPELHAKSTQTVPIMYLTWLGSALVATGGLLGRRGALRLGVALGLGTVAAMADIGSRAVVPGANDNLSAVAVLLAIAQSLRERPLEDVRVILLSTGSEESFMEGMRGFARRHFPDLDRERTELLCLECVGGPTLVVLEGEGMLWMRDYPQRSRAALAAAAERAGVAVKRGLRTVAATDALIALRAGYEVATLASVDETNFPANYHWPSDDPDNLVWGTIGQAVAVTERFLRGRADAL